MIPPGLVQFLIYLVLPLVVVNFMSGRHLKDTRISKSNPFSSRDYATYGVLAILSSYYIWSAMFLQPPNIFKELGASPKDSCFRLRYKLKDYTVAHPDILPADGIVPKATKSSNDFNVLEYYTSSKYGRMEFLVDRFCKYEDDVEIYLKFGEDAFYNSIESDFGPRGMSPRGAHSINDNNQLPWQRNSDISYYLYVASAQFFTYLPAFFVVGILTTPLMVTKRAPSRGSLRRWADLALFVLYMADLFNIFTVPNKVKEREAVASLHWVFGPDRADPRIFFADTIVFTRRIFLSACVAAFIVMDVLVSPRQTEVQLLKACVNKQNDLLALTKNYTMLETGVLVNSGLRDRFTARWRREESARQKILSEETMSELFDDESRKAGSERWAEQVLPDALRMIGIQTNSK